MELIDFKEPLIPLNKWGNEVDEDQIRKWYMAGYLRTNTTRPDFMVDAFALTEAGMLHATGIDVTAWPYICGKMARGHGKSRDSHGLIGNSEKLWVAGWDEGAK